MPPLPFKGLMNSVFHAMIDRFVLVYLDDLLVHSENATMHEHYLSLVL